MDLLKKALIISIASLYLCSNIELPLYKPLKLNSENILIDEIDKTQFLTNFTMGVSNEKIPLQIEMSSEEICLIDENSFISIKEITFLKKHNTNFKPLQSVTVSFPSLLSLLRREIFQN